MELKSEGMEPHLVITGLISTDPGPYMVEISATTPYFNLELPVNIQAEEVRIDFDGDGEIEYYQASTTVPYIHTLDALSLRSLMPSGNDTPFLLMAGFLDTPGEDYYGAALWVNNVLYSNRILRYYVQ